jgi:IclR-like helix-turn-helix domain-containing protein
MIDENSTRVLPHRREGKRSGRHAKGGDSNASGAAADEDWQREEQAVRREVATRTEPGAETVLIELSKAQVDQVVRTAGQGGAMSVLLSSLRDPKWSLGLESEDWAYPAQMEDRRLSRSLLSGLLVLSCFPPDGGYLGIAELARMLDMNTSTTHRYVTTLLAVGLLERDPATRRYRVAAQ